MIFSAQKFDRLGCAASPLVANRWIVRLHVATPAQRGDPLLWGSEAAGLDESESRKQQSRHVAHSFFAGNLNPPLPKFELRFRRPADVLVEEHGNGLQIQFRI